MISPGEGLRPLEPYGFQGAPVGPPSTPARRFCPNRDRPDWLWWGHHCTQDANLQRRYGITCDDYWELYGDQDGRCGVCRRPSGPGRRLVVDHDHDTGEIEGLCHFGCNRPISAQVRRYVKNPPGRRLGLVVSAGKLRAIEEQYRAKRARYAKSHPKRSTPVPPSNLDKLRAMTRKGA
jgi:Recombination endonuclease VII